MVPDIPFTCTSTAEGGGRIIDFGLASGSLAPKLQCIPVWDVPFKPHIVALDFILDIGFMPDLGNELLIPADIPSAVGPREAKNLGLDAFRLQDRSSAMQTTSWKSADRLHLLQRKPVWLPPGPMRFTPMLLSAMRLLAARR